MNITDWEAVRKAGRAKIVYLDVRKVTDYFLVTNKDDSAFYNAGLMSIVDTYDLPENWSLGSVHHNYERRAFSVVIYSPDFDVVPAGTMLPVLYETRNAATIMRTIIRHDDHLSRKSIA